MGYQIEEKNCCKCGKRFVPAVYHKYEHNGRLYCSWTCYLHRADGIVRPNSKPVYQYTLSGVLIKTFQSAAEAASSIGMQKAGNIRDCCLGKTKTSGGYVWSYEKRETPSHADQSIG